MFPSYSPFIINISKLISNFFNPMTSLVIYFIYFGSGNYTFKEGIHIFLPILLLVIIPISFWIIWNVKKGKYTNMDVSNRKQRKSLYFFIAITIITYLLYNYFQNENIDLVMIFLLVLLLVMQISNYFIKSSMHTAFNIFVAALFFSQNPFLGIIWLGIAVLVGITRIILKKHTPREVLLGGIISFFVSFIYLYTHIQFQQ